MHLRYLLLLLSGATLGLACSRLSDASNPMNRTLSDVPYMDAISLRTSYDRCLGSVDITALMNGLLGAATAEPTCQRAIADLVPMYSEYIWTSSGSSGDGSAMDDALDFTNAKAQKLCTTLLNVVPCLEKAIVPFVLKTINAGGCCTAALSDLATDFGAPIDVVVATLVRDLGNVLCSTQSPGFFNQGNQTCAYALAQSVLHAAVPVGRLVEAVAQLPTSEACKALVANAPFQMTQWRAMTPLFTAPYLPSTCVQPIDALISGVARWPWIQTTDMSKMLSASSCLSNPEEASQCLHLASGFASTCTYTTSLQLFTQALAPTKSSSSGSTTVSSVALIILSILYFYL
ncbi:hypothetical protein SPRG_05303 [Saprolegnia parasitica CBS 223.65]|uniref:Secreted protein n=1 Tax=Saprolegnia parasitica (strain CBS 223.65) TaxID=695850 RepID=A0A067CUA5_SAPPC|nr:hypothetical protein SPRG_05303 [Saprolegnia parasitica CBS 223.65]KDO30111.1 hypothetical protein SPRG_05303 [Saprolegnia parasitica CBS 223.65]|eukprot:XP_012199291.1 hypothetical protein SPRG_05303 [Saprolegnia parasitica CBS 223.65]